MAVLFANDTIGPSSEYQEQLRKEHDGSKWGSSGARYSGTDVLGLLRERPYIETVLDFGAGKASLESFIRERLERDISWTNYDPGMPAYDTLPQRQFDLVITTDVMEHIEPEQVVETIGLLGKLTKKVLFNDIACYPTGTIFGEGPYKGKDMHLTIIQPSMWRQQFEEHSGLQELIFEHREKLSRVKTKIRCIMIHERI